MSDYECWSGTLKKIDVLEYLPVEERARYICLQEKYIKSKYQKNYVEVLRECGRKKYLVFQNNIYIIDTQEHNPYENYIHVYKDEENELLIFNTRFYNGTTSLDEILEHELKELKEENII
jgi:hypothetical protein